MSGCITVARESHRTPNPTDTSSALYLAHHQCSRRPHTPNRASALISHPNSRGGVNQRREATSCATKEPLPSLPGPRACLLPVQAEYVGEEPDSLVVLNEAEKTSKCRRLFVREARL